MRLPTRKDIAVRFLWAGSLLLAFEALALFILGNPFAGAAAFYLGLACLMLAAGFHVAVFFADRTRNKRQLLYALCIVLLPFLWNRAITTVVEAIDQQREKEVVQTIQQLAADVHDIHDRTQHVPEDREELAQLLGRPVPTTPWGSALSYRLDKSDREQFTISATAPAFDHTHFEYSSGNHAQGVVVTRY